MLSLHSRIWGLDFQKYQTHPLPIARTTKHICNTFTHTHNDTNELTLLLTQCKISVTAIARAFTFDIAIAIITWVPAASEPCPSQGQIQMCRELRTATQIRATHDRHVRVLVPGEVERYRGEEIGLCVFSPAFLSTSSKATRFLGERLCRTIQAFPM